MKAVRRGHAQPPYGVDPEALVSGAKNRTRKVVKMPKMKTKASAKKRFRLTGTGKMRANVGYKQHNLRKRPKKMKRKARGTMLVSDADARIIKSYLPYA